MPIVANPGINTLPVANQPNNSFDGTGISPFSLFRITNDQAGQGWLYSLDRTAGLSAGSTTDGGPGCKWLYALVNSGTATCTSTQSGYEGAIVSATGTATNNTNGWASVDGYLGTQGRIAWMMWNLYMPATASTVSATYFLGLINKQLSPVGTVPTNGVYMQIVQTASSTAVLTGYSVTGSGTATAAAPTVTLPGTAQSIQLGLVYQYGTGANWLQSGGVDFWYRTPATNPTFSGAEPWINFASISYTTAAAAPVVAPLNTVVLRPTFAHACSNSGNSQTANFESASYGIQPQTLR